MVVWAAFSRASIGPTARIHRACPSAQRVRERALVGSEGAGAVPARVSESASVGPAVRFCADVPIAFVDLKNHR